jgi:hypothetical protein
MPSIRITRFAGIQPQVNPKLLPNDHAQIAHNCLLWDGWLRPMPQWQLLQTAGANVVSLYADPNAGPEYSVDTVLKRAFLNTQEPYGINTVVGINGALPVYRNSVNAILDLGVPVPVVGAVKQTIAPQNISVYPIARTYALTYMVGSQESSPVVLDQIGANGTLFEGDFVQLSVQLALFPQTASGVTAIRLYRTIPGFDTSEQLGNPVDTGFHLVTEQAVDPTMGTNPFLYTDNQDSSQIPGDLLISDQWLPPALAQVNYLDQTDGGWAVIAKASDAIVGNVQVSERYMHSAWPAQNLANIPATITDMRAFYDDVFFGTDNKPYHMHVAMGEGDALALSVRYFPDNYACVPNSMSATNFGAMYAANEGLIALTASADTVASKRVMNPGDGLITPAATFTTADTQASMWWNGNFFGFTGAGGYVYNQPNPNNNEFPLGQLVTIDLPNGVVGPNLILGGGALSAWGNNVYTFSLPGYGYESAPKATYTWKTKRYVMPGLYTWSAAKVVNDESGTLTFLLFVDDVLVYTRPVTHSNPFRIPHQHKGIEVYMILTGTSVVQELHLATGMRDLVEEP